MIVIFVELFSLIFLLILSGQSSSFWSSLVIVPFGFFLVLMSSGLGSFSGFLVIIFCMVFIGGLLVLLVSVSSVSFNEQGFSVSSFMVLGGFLLSPFLFSFQIFSDSSGSVLFLLKWLDNQGGTLVFLILILLVSLLLLSNNISYFKGLMRLV